MNDTNHTAVQHDEETLGKVILYLLKEKYLEEKDLRYAQRVQAKLSPPKSLLEVLKELEYIDDNKITLAIQANRDNLKLGTLLVELGHITQKDLDDALQMQYEGKASRKIGDILIENHLIDEKRMI